MLHLLLALFAWAIAILLTKFNLFRPPREGFLYCGLFGFSGNRAADETKLRLLAVENQSRGSDSTGVYGNHVYKDNVTARTFIQSKGFKAAVKGARTVGGHTRSATWGDKTAANAHPFAYGANDLWYTVGAHNGFIFEQMLAYHTKEFGFEKNAFSVDSQLIFATISKYKNINIIPSIEGAMTIWFCLPNKSPDTIYLYQRGQARSLSLGQAKEGIYFSSEADPLRMIDCKEIFSAAADTLYTLHKGEIVDRYKMDTPRVKSLAVNAQRGNWRLGVPDAEIRALPVIVPLLTQSNASSYQNKKYDGGYDDYTHPSKSHVRHVTKEFDEKLDKGAYKLFDPVVDNFDAELDKRFHLVIKTLNKELESMEVTALKLEDNLSYQAQDFIGCFLLVKLVNAESKAPLIAWSVIGKSTDIAGITGFEGITAIEIPTAECGKTLCFTAYDPIDHLGAFGFTVTPEKNRVMEVTLSIPFREKPPKEGEEGGTTKEINNKLALVRDFSSAAGNPLHSPAFAKGGPPSQFSKSDLGILRRSTRSISLPLAAEYVDGQDDLTEVSSDLLPETEPNVKTRDIRYHLMLPNCQSRVAKRSMLKWLLERRKSGGYVNWSMPGYLSEFAAKHKQVNPSLAAYSSSIHADSIEYVDLIADAARVSAWDRYHAKAWYKLPLYIGMLLAEVPQLYLPSHAYIAGASENDYNVIPEHFFPNKLVKKIQYQLAGTTSEYKVALPKVDKKVMYDVILWTFNPKIIKRDMSAKELESLQQGLLQNTVVLEQILSEAGQALKNAEEHATAEAIQLKAALIKCRNFMFEFKTDIEELSDQVSVRIGASNEAETISSE